MFKACASFLKELQIITLLDQVVSKPRFKLSFSPNEGETGGRGGVPVGGGTRYGRVIWKPTRDDDTISGVPQMKASTVTVV